MMILQPRIKSFVTLGHNFLLFAFLFFAVSCGSSNIEQKSDAQVTNTPVVQNELENKAASLSKFYDDKNCIEFITAFPDTFQDFYKLYGFDDEEGEHILYSKTEHIVYFFDCPDVSNRERLEKVIKIGIDGKWDADATAMFQASAFDLVKHSSNETKEILNNLPDEKSASFWYFLIDGPHPNDKEIVKRVKILNNLLDENSKQSKLLSEQYEKLKTDWKNH